MKDIEKIKKANCRHAEMKSRLAIIEEWLTPCCISETQIEELHAFRTFMTDLSEVEKEHVVKLAEVGLK